MAGKGRRPRTPEEHLIEQRLGRNIVLARELRGLTGGELGELLGGRGKSSISEWETGKHGPDAFVIPQLCEVLKVTPTWIFEGTLRRLQRDGIEAVSRRVAKRIGLPRMALLAALSAEDLAALDSLLGFDEKTGRNER